MCTHRCAHLSTKFNQERNRSNKLAHQNRRGLGEKKRKTPKIKAHLDVHIDTTCAHREAKMIMNKTLPTKRPRW